MDAVDSWVAGCEWRLELLGQVYGEEYPGKYDLFFQKVTLQGGMGGGGAAESYFSEAQKCDTPSSIVPGCAYDHLWASPLDTCYALFPCQVTTLSSREFPDTRISYRILGSYAKWQCVPLAKYY